MTTTLDQAQSFYSDFHKELYGFRPRPQIEQWENIDWLNAAIDELRQAAPAIYAEEEAQEQAAIAKFEKLVTATMEIGARDRATAIRWLREVDEYAAADDGYFEYLNGLPYGYIAKHQ